MTAIRTLLVANRGEIAVRVMRTARALGIRTVAVYSAADRDAPHVAAADLAVAIGPAPVGESYLDAAKILDAAARTGADAIHPGYGFLSENAAFADACAAAGVVFVGPPAAAMRAMGDKIAAKTRMIEAGVPTAPAHVGRDSAPAELQAAAARIGFPILVKAAAGGGGRGMRIVRSPDALAEAIASASSEARNAFGSGDVFLEKLVEGARHVEVQVFCDRHGAGIHLGERECSVQRRHQKIIEEAPSPVVDAELRARMGAAAVTAAKAIGYVGAGTVEFLLDDDRSFYFLEMNTRLQVEHPVTELVTGLDLVHWQLRIAEGEPLPLTQDQVRLAGHAIEVRIYAEDPYAGFLPQTGEILRWRAAEGPHVRVDAGIRTGQSVSPYYDPMLAKVIAHGPRRGDAIRVLDRAVADSVLLGVTTNRAFLRELLTSEAFVAAEIRTDTLDRRTELPAAPVPSALAWAVAACARLRQVHDRVPGSTDASAWRSGGAVYPAPIELVHGDAARRLQVLALGGDRYRVEAAGETVELAFVDRDAHGRVAVEHAGIRRWFDVVVTADAVAIDDDGRAFLLLEPRLAAEVPAAAGADGRVRVPMGGRVLSVAVAAGERVEAGQTLAIIEAMKMEHRVLAPVAGTIREVAIAAGGQATAGAIAFQFEPEAGRGEG